MRKNAEGQEKEEPRKGKYLSFGRRASVKKQETKDYIIIAAMQGRSIGIRIYNLRSENHKQVINKTSRTLKQQKATNFTRYEGKSPTKGHAFTAVDFWFFHSFYTLSFLTFIILALVLIQWEPCNEVQSYFCSKKCQQSSPTI